MVSERKTVGFLVNSIMEDQSRSLEQKLARRSRILEGLQDLHKAPIIETQKASKMVSEPEISQGFLGHEQGMSSHLNQFLEEFLDEWASEIHQNEVNSFLSTMGFPSLPSFLGVNPKDWINGIEVYFEVYPSMEIYQFSLVEGLLVGRAKEWDASWSFDGNYDDYWNEFVDALCDRFENNDDEKVDELVGYESTEEKHLVVGKDSAIDVVLLVEPKCCNIVEGLCEIEDVTNKESVVESCVVEKFCGIDGVVLGNEFNNENDSKPGIDSESTKELGSEITLKINGVHEVCQEHSREVRDVLLDVSIATIPRKETPVKFDVVTQEMGYNHLCDIVCALGTQATEQAWSRKIRGDWFDVYSIELGKISPSDVCRDSYDFDVKSKPPDDSGNVLEVAPLAGGNSVQCILSDSYRIIHGDSKVNHPKIALESLDCATVDVWFLLSSVNYKDTSQSTDELSFVSMIQQVMYVCLQQRFQRQPWKFWPQWQPKDERHEHLQSSQFFWDTTNPVRIDGLFVIMVFDPGKRTAKLFGCDAAIIYKLQFGIILSAKYLPIVVVPQILESGQEPDVVTWNASLKLMKLHVMSTTCAKWFMNKIRPANVRVNYKSMSSVIDDIAEIGEVGEQLKDVCFKKVVKMMYSGKSDSQRMLTRRWKVIEIAYVNRATLWHQLCTPVAKIGCIHEEMKMNSFKVMFVNFRQNFQQQMWQFLPWRWEDWLEDIFKLHLFRGTVKVHARGFVLTDCTQSFEELLLRLFGVILGLGTNLTVVFSHFIMVSIWTFLKRLVKLQIWVYCIKNKCPETSHLWMQNTIEVALRTGFQFGLKLKLYVRDTLMIMMEIAQVFDAVHLITITRFVEAIVFRIETMVVHVFDPGGSKVRFLVSNVVPLAKNLHSYRLAEMVFLSWLYKLFDDWQDLDSEKTGWEDEENDSGFGLESNFSTLEDKCALKEESLSETLYQATGGQ